MIPWNSKFSSRSISLKFRIRLQYSFQILLYDDCLETDSPRSHSEKFRVISFIYTQHKRQLGTRNFFTLLRFLKFVEDFKFS